MSRETLPDLDYTAPEIPLNFDQASKFQFQTTYKDTNGDVVNLSGYGARMTLYNSISELYLSLTTANGKVVLSSTEPTIVATFLATDTNSGSSIHGHDTGKWSLYLDPDGTASANSFKVAGGIYRMIPVGPST